MNAQRGPREAMQRLIEPDSILKIDRGGLLYLPEDQTTSFLFQGAVLAPAADFKRVGSGQFELTTTKGQRVQALDIITDDNGKAAVVVGVADGDTCQAPSMRGVFVAAVYTPLKKMGARYKNETDTFYLGAHQIKSVQPGAAAKLGDIDGFVRAYLPFRGFFKTAEGLQKHLKLPFVEQIARMKLSALEHIAKDVALKMRAQPAVAARVKQQREGQMEIYAAALLKKKDDYGLPFKERFKVVAPRPPLAPADPAAAATAATVPAGSASTSAPAPASTTAAAAGGGAKSLRSGAVVTPVPSPVRAVPKAKVSKAPAPGAATAASVALVAKASTPKSGAAAHKSVAAGTAGEKRRRDDSAESGLVAAAIVLASNLRCASNAKTAAPAPALATGALPAAALNISETSNKSLEAEDQGDDDSLDDDFPTLEELAKKKKRKGRDSAVASSSILASKRRSGAPVSNSASALTPTTPSSAATEPAKKVLSGTGVRGGHGAYLTIKKAQEIADRVSKGDDVPSPEQKKAAAKLGRESLLPPRPTQCSLAPSRELAGGVEKEAKYLRLEKKLEEQYELINDLRGQLATKAGEVAARDSQISIKDKELERNDAAISSLTMRISEQDKALEELRSSALDNFERGLQKGMASKFMAASSS